MRQEYSPCNSPDQHTLVILRILFTRASRGNLERQKAEPGIMRKITRGGGRNINQEMVTRKAVHDLLRYVSIHEENISNLPIPVVDSDKHIIC